MLYLYTDVLAITLYRILGITLYANIPYRREQTINLYSVYTYTHYNTIPKANLYSVFANTGYNPIRRGCVYTYKLILFYGI